MKTSAYSKPIIALANFFSSIFAPLFIPTYCTMIIMSDTALQGLSGTTRLITIIVVCGLTAVLPLLMLVVLKRRGVISDIDVSNRGQRGLPIALIFGCYILTMIYVFSVHAPLWLDMYFASGCVTAVVVGLITILAKWKISMHGAGMGNALGMILAIWVYGYAERPLMALLLAAILLTGIVGSSRVILNRHTLGQVFAGVAVSGLITFFMM